MPYSIKVLDGSDVERIHVALQKKVRADGRFNVESCVDGQTILLKRVRLVTAKEYCGNHPGECVVTFPPRKKPKARFLEWQDWVDFHGIVNDLLDSMNVSADVWSRPQDARGKFWIRKGNSRRIHFDWTEEPTRWGTPLRVWNCGTPDQFVQG